MVPQHVHSKELKALASNLRKNSLFGEAQKETCAVCNQSKPSSTAEFFNGKHEELLAEIDAAKEELIDIISQLKQLESVNEDDPAEIQIFNVENLEVLQESLEKAEESGDAILFTDQKKNAWQINCLKNVNIDYESNEVTTKELLLSTERRKIKSKLKEAPAK